MEEKETINYETYLKNAGESSDAISLSITRKLKI